MRSGIVGAGGIAVMVLTVTAWVGIAPPDHAASVPTPPAVVLDVDEQWALPDHLVRAAPLDVSEPATIRVAASATAAADEAPMFVEELNALRATRGIDELERRAELDALAQSWATRMAADDHLHHSALIYDVIEGSWFTAGENVGYGPSVGVIFAALRESPGHLENMLNPDFTSVGIGVVRSGDVLWTAHLFAG